MLLYNNYKNLLNEVKKKYLLQKFKTINYI